VNVTPFSSANGIFIELTFSSGVIVGEPLCYLPSSKTPETITYRVKPGNDVRGSCRDKRS
jgi:hypothetical protein